MKTVHEITDGLAPIGNTLDVTVTGGNGPPTASAILRDVDEDGPTLNVDLLVDANASDPDASDVLSGSERRSDDYLGCGQGVKSWHALHGYVGAAFELTAAGFALFNDLAEGETDAFALDYEVTDGTAPIGNTLDVTVNGSNDDPTASAIVSGRSGRPVRSMLTCWQTPMRRIRMPETFSPFKTPILKSRRLVVGPSILASTTRSPDPQALI